MDTTDLTSRRAVLTGAGVVLGGAVLAACGGGSSDGDGDNDGDDDKAAAGSPTAAAPSSGAASGSSAGALAKVADVPVGSAISAKGSDGKPIIIAQPTKGTIKAFSAICTHQGCTVAPAGKQLDCPCHGSVYNASTGAVIKGPAPAPLPAVPVHVSGDDVVAGA